jgi:hypothetical protein
MSEADLAALLRRTVPPPLGAADDEADEGLRID